MKTTVNIPDKVLRDAIKYSRARTYREAIVTAMEEFNRRRRMAELVKLAGTSSTFMTNDEIEGLDREPARRRSGRRSKS
jgi:hypothetical protein